MIQKDPESSRRKLLTTIGSGSIGISSLSYTINAEDYTEIVIARGGLNDEIKSTAYVPTKWNNHVEAIEVPRKRLSQLYRSREFVNGVGLVSYNEDNNISYSQIELKVDPDIPDDELAALPSSLEETNINVPTDVVITDISISRETKELKLGGCTDNLYHDKPIPAGYYTKWEFDGGSKVSQSTAGYRVYDSGAGEERMLTANHVISHPNDNQCTLGTGNVLECYYNDDIGTGTSKGNYGLDWILLDPHVNLSDEIYGGAGRQPLDGWVTKKGIKVIRDKDYVVENYGSFTGWSTGYIQNVTHSFTATCVTFIEQGVKASVAMGDGDSGGPIWFDNSDGTFIIGHNSAFDPQFSKSCTPIGSANYGPYAVTFPFFRIKSNNPEFSVGSKKYSG